MECQDEEFLRSSDFALSDPDCLSELNEWRLDFDESESDESDIESVDAEAVVQSDDQTDEESLEGGVVETKEAVEALLIESLWQPQPRPYAFLDFTSSFLAKCNGEPKPVGGMPSVPLRSQSVCASESDMVEFALQAMLGFQSDLFQLNHSDNLDVRQC
jgi:hypothetical protein